MTRKMAFDLRRREGPTVRWDDVDLEVKLELKDEIERTLHREVQEEIIDWRMSRAMAYERAREKGENNLFTYLIILSEGFFLLV